LPKLKPSSFKSNSRFLKAQNITEQPSSIKLNTNLRKSEENRELIFKPNPRITKIQSKVKMKEYSMYHAYSILANKKLNASHLPSLRASIEANNSAIESKTNSLEISSNKAQNKNFHLHKMQTKSELVKEIELYLSLPIPAIENQIHNEDIQNIQKENLQIYSHLKKFNNLLTKLLAFKNNENYSRKPEKLNISVELNLQKEENYEKWLNYYKTEYEQLAQRIEKLENFSYFEGLTSVCSTLNKKIQKLRDTIDNKAKDVNISSYVHKFFTIFVEICTIS